jgi:hypothetical protein
MKYRPPFGRSRPLDPTRAAAIRPVQIGLRSTPLTSSDEERVAVRGIGEEMAALPARLRRRWEAPATALMRGHKQYCCLQTPHPPPPPPRNLLTFRVDRRWNRWSFDRTDSESMDAQP